MARSRIDFCCVHAVTLIRNFAIRNFARQITSHVLRIALILLVPLAALVPSAHAAPPWQEGGAGEDGAARTSANESTRSARETAASGASVRTEVRAEADGYRATVRMDVPVSRAVAWDVVTDYGCMARFLPGFERSAVVSRKGEVVEVEQLAVEKILLVSQKIRLRSSLVHHPRESIDIQAIEGDFRRFTGSYRFEDSAGGTRIRYDADFVPDFPLPPFGTLALFRSGLQQRFDAMVSEMLRRAARGAGEMGKGAPDRGATEKGAPDRGATGC